MRPVFLSALDLGLRRRRPQRAAPARRAHSRLAGRRVTHAPRVVDGRRGDAWDPGSPRGVWYHAAWFPRPDHSVRVECIARRQTGRFKRLCAEAIGSLRFH